jgi:hypothetical protein
MSVCLNLLLSDSLSYTESYATHTKHLFVAVAEIRFQSVINLIGTLTLYSSYSTVM